MKNEDKGLLTANYRLLTTQVCGLARETGLFLKTEIGKLQEKDILSKGLHDFVTYVDKASEQRLVAGLKNILPGTGFIAEESPEMERKALNWIIDPLDGTTNFIHGVPLYCISIALMDKDELVIGVVYEANLDECFYTWQGAPSYMNGKEIRVSETPLVYSSLFATGFPYYDYGRLDAYISLFRYLMQHSHGVRRLGSAAADLAYVACGRYDGFYEYGLRSWDVAAGALLVKNAGGVVSDFSGKENYIFGKEIMAMNGNVYEEFLEVLKKNFV
jgi:myo-inositol-1(or 4)-monophosphatase